MQNIMKKLLNAMKIPQRKGEFLIKLPKVAKKKPLDFEKGDITEAEYEEFKDELKCMPRTRASLVKVLEDKLGLTNACLSSYIQFKRQALGLLMAEQQRRAGAHSGGTHAAAGDQDEYLETQSSLDEDNGGPVLQQNTADESPTVGSVFFQQN